MSVQVAMDSFWNTISTMVCNSADLIPLLHGSDCWIFNFVSAKSMHHSSTNHGQTTVEKRKGFPLLFVYHDRLWIEIFNYMVSTVVALLSGTALVVLVGIDASNYAMAGTTSVVPDNSTNLSSSNHIVFNSYNNMLIIYFFSCSEKYSGFFNGTNSRPQPASRS